MGQTPRVIITNHFVKVNAQQKRDWKHSNLFSRGASRIWTGDDGVADRGLTTWLSRHLLSFKAFALSSPSRARTYNPSVNSRVLYHWAIEDYSFSLRWNCYSFWLYTQNHTLKSFIRGDNSSFLPSWISPRPISISQLHVLPHFHLWPINLVVFKGS